MHKPIVAVVRYEEPLASVRKAVDLSGGLDHLPARARVFIKPNVIFWTCKTVFPKYGVITTSRLVEDAVVLLKERGVDDITIGEGLVTRNPKDRETPAHAFASLGYNTLSKRYGVKVLDLHQRPFEEVDLGDGVTLAFNADFLETDFLVNIPVLKCHAQTIVSLGTKNLKGLIDIPSRKKCHKMIRRGTSISWSESSGTGFPPPDDPGRDLHERTGPPVRREGEEDRRSGSLFGYAGRRHGRVPDSGLPSVRDPAPRPRGPRSGQPLTRLGLNCGEMRSRTSPIATTTRSRTPTTMRFPGPWRRWASRGSRTGNTTCLCAHIARQSTG